MKQYRASSFAIIMSALILGPSAFAQTQGDDEADIVVTGSRDANASITGSDVTVLRYPQSISVIDSAMLERIGATRLDAALDLAGGVARQNDFGGLWDKYSIRGFAGDENGGPDILINRFASNLGFTPPIDVATVERFEFLKGAAAALSGRGEPGGSLNIVTKAPPEEFQANASLSYGSWNAFRATGDIGGPINDMLAVRLIGVVEDKDSFRNYVHSNRELIAPSIAFTPSDKLRFLYQAEYMRNRTPMDRGVVAIGGDARAMDRNTFLGEPGDGRMNHKIFWQQASMFASLAENLSLEVGLSHRIGSLRGYGTIADFGARGLQSDGRTIGRMRRYHDFSWNDLSARAELVSKFDFLGLSHDVRIGFDRVRHGLDKLMTQARGTPAAPILTIDAFNPVYGKTSSSFAPLQNWHASFHSESIYAQDLIELGQFTLLLGGRWNSFRETLTNHLRSDALLQTENRGFTPRAALTWQFLDGLSLYSSWGESLRLNPSDGVSTFDAEKSDSAEVGAKYRLFGGKLSGQVALFDMNKRNVLNPNATDPFIKTQIGRQRSRGVETELTLNLPSGLFVSATYTHLKATVENDNNAALIGTRLSNVPNDLAAIYANQRWGRLAVGAGVSYVGERNGDPYASGYILPRYTIARADLSYEINDRFGARFDVDNLFDAYYITSSYANVWTTPGAPRSFRVTLTGKF
ncbi:MAG: TonB-dependent siderophore receptor [Novosphingobium sp.]|nr:TonB-dependent siderophore receptor [Novosphingobium sp.]